jgi:hypothetical protein
MRKQINAVIENTTEMNDEVKSTIKYLDMFISKWKRRFQLEGQTATDLIVNKGGTWYLDWDKAKVQGASGESVMRELSGFMSSKGIDLAKMNKGYLISFK